MAIMGFFIITLLPPIATFCKKQRFRGVLEAKRLKILSKKRLFSIQILVFFYAFYRKTSYDAAKITS